MIRELGSDRLEMECVLHTQYLDSLNPRELV